MRCTHAVPGGKEQASAPGELRAAPWRAAAGQAPGGLYLYGVRTTPEEEKQCLSRRLT